MSVFTPPTWLLKKSQFTPNPMTMNINGNGKVQLVEPSPSPPTMKILKELQEEPRLYCTWRVIMLNFWKKEDLRIWSKNILNSLVSRFTCKLRRPLKKKSLMTRMRMIKRKRKRTPRRKKMMLKLKKTKIKRKRKIKRRKSRKLLTNWRNATKPNLCGWEELKTSRRKNTQPSTSP